VKTAIILAIPLLLAAAPLAAQEKPLGDFKGWQAYSFTESGKKVCVIWAKPKKSTGKYKKRGAVRVFVAHRRWTRPKRINEISFEAGYNFKKDSEARVTIDAKPYALFTDGDTAWNRAAKDDARMVKAMRVGKTLVIKGVSRRGTKTTDTYSLFGFTAAHNAINKACKVK
jgi:hypothetical protein